MARILPKGYRQLEYILSTGTQYIITTYVPTTNSKIEAKVKFGTSTYASICGARQASNMTGQMFGYYSGNFQYQFGNSGSKYSVACEKNIEYTIVSDCTGFTVNGTQMYSGSYTSTNTLPLYLFANNENGSATWKGINTIYYLKCYESEELVHSFIPAKRTSDSVVGMYDLVSKTFFTNAGTGTFTAGPVVDLPETGYKELQWIKGTGTQYIELNSVFDTTDKIEIKTGLLDLSQDKFLVSTKTWNPNNNRFVMAGGNASTRGVGFGNSVTGSCIYTPSVTKVSGQVSVETYENYVFTYTEGTTVATCDKTGTTFGESTTNIRLFYGYNTTTSGQIYYWSHWKVVNGTLTLIEHLIPVIQQSNSEVGMYDTVNDVFYTNAGTGTFIEGPLCETVYNVKKQVYIKPTTLPSGYTELEYIEGTGTQCISLGDYEASTVKMVIDSSFTNTTGGRHGNVTGTRCYFGIVSGQWAVGYNSSYDHALGTADIDRHIFTRSSTQFMVDDTVLKSYTSQTVYTVPLYLFAATDSGGPKYKVSGKVYSCKIYGDGTNLSFNGIPAKNSDDVVGMYDTVSDTFFPSATSTAFVAGPQSMYKIHKKCYVINRLPSEYQALEYIESSGTQYIDTGLVFNTKMEVTMHTSIASLSVAQSRWFGTDTYSVGLAVECTNGLVRGLYSSTYTSVATPPIDEKFLIHALCYSGHQEFTIGDVTATSSISGTDVGNLNFILFGSTNGTSSISKLISAKIYDFQVNMNDSLVANYIPAKRVSDSVIGMYDTVSKTFFENAGTGDFTAGPETTAYDVYKIKKSNLYIGG